MMKVAAVLLALALTVQQAAAHVTLSPNYGGAAGNYFAFDVKIPHGQTQKDDNDNDVDMDTTKIEITVPHGVLSVKPEAVYGWDIAIVERDIVSYLSHEVMISKAPATITYTARCENGGDNGATCTNDDHGGLDNNHLMLLSMQVKLGCDFGVDVNGVETSDATVWEGQHTVWWRVKQWASTEGTNDGNVATDAHMDWKGVAKGSEAWSSHSGPKPSPYLFIYSDDACTGPDHSGGDTSNGMRWGVSKEVIAPVKDQDPIKTKAELLSSISSDRKSVV